MKVKIDVSKLNTVKRKQKALRVSKQMEIIYNSPEFKKIFIETFDKYSNEFKIGELSKLKNYSPIRLFNHFMSGYEVLNPEKDQILNIWVDDYYSIKNVIGYTLRDIKGVYVNTKFFDIQSDIDSGSNLTHEYTHKQGGEHAFSNTYYRKYSYSYLMNLVYEEAAKAVLPEIYKEKTKNYYTPWYKKAWRKIKSIF